MNKPRSSNSEPDSILETVADYVLSETTFTQQTYTTAAYCLVDSLGCALASLENRDCRRIISPLCPGMQLTSGITLPGVEQADEPVTAAFKLGSMIRWLDYNDTWLAKEWGHPSDNLGAIIVAALYLAHQDKHITVKDLLTAMIKAYEIQGCLAVDNCFNQVGLDHVILVRIASAAIATAMLGGNKQQLINALSNAWADGGPLRNYRHAPDTGTRKSWAAGDASARGLWLALMSINGEMGYPHVLTTPRWGFSDSLMRDKELKISRKLDSYVMDNILFKVSFPAEFHAQTAIEVAIRLHQQYHSRLQDIESIHIETQQAGNLIINKTGELNNPADRDHCLQYMVAVAMLHGDIKASDYLDTVGTDPAIRQLREKMYVTENDSFTRQYHDPALRAIPNAIQLTFNNGSQSKRTEVAYPLGHRARRDEARPKLIEKFRRNSLGHMDSEVATTVVSLLDDIETMNSMTFCDYFRNYTS